MLMQNLETETDPDADLLRHLLGQSPIDYRHNVAFDCPDNTHSKFRPAKKLFEVEIDMSHAGRFWAKLDASLALSLHDRRAIPVDKSLLLTSQQEKMIFLQMNYARYRVHRLQLLYRKRSAGIWPFKLTNREESDLLKWYRLSQRLSHDIINANFGLVGLMLQKFTLPSDILNSDIVAEGRFVLMRATDKFDVGHGFKFSTYACRAIYQAFARVCQKRNMYHKRYVVYSQIDFYETSQRGDGTDEGPDRNISLKESSEHLHRVLDRNEADLTDAEQRILKMRFPMDPDVKSMTLKEVGSVIGVTKERSRQIQNKALEKIKAILDPVFN